MRRLMYCDVSRNTPINRICSFAELRFEKKLPRRRDQRGAAKKEKCSHCANFEFLVIRTMCTGFLVFIQ